MGIEFNPRSGVHPAPRKLAEMVRGTPHQEEDDAQEGGPRTHPISYPGEKGHARIDGKPCLGHSAFRRNHLGQDASPWIEEEGNAPIRCPGDRHSVLYGPEDQMGRVLMKKERPEESVLAAKPNVAAEVHEELGPGFSALPSRSAKKGFVA
jgi:hypothetical protein